MLSLSATKKLPEHLMGEETPPYFSPLPLDNISEIVVDKRVLESFKRKALRRYPNEFIESLWGCVRGDKAFIHYTQTFDHTATGNRIFVPEDTELHDDDEPGAIKLLGTIHTHPGQGSVALPSSLDMLSHLEDDELIMGILAISLRGKRRFCSFNFFSGDAILLLTIAENSRS